MAPSTEPDQPIPFAVWRLAAVIVFGAFMSGLEASVINVGLDSIARELDTDLVTVQWATDGYLLALGVSLPVCGWLGRRVGMGAPVAGRAGCLHGLRGAVCTGADNRVADRVACVAGYERRPAHGHIRTEAQHFPPAIIDAWREAGPLRVQREVADRLQRLAGRGQLHVKDVAQAAAHFSALVTAGVPLPPRGSQKLTNEQTRAAVTAGVDAFLHGYATDPRPPVAYGRGC